MKSERLQYQRCCEDLVQVYSKDKFKLHVLLGFVADRVNEKGNKTTSVRLSVCPSVRLLAV